MNRKLGWSTDHITTVEAFLNSFADTIAKAKIARRIELCFIVVLCVAAIIAPLAALIIPLRPASESLPGWFQRSGAVTSVFAVLAQFRISAFYERIRGGTFAESWQLFHFFIGHYRLVSTAVATVTVVGAIIWGYGDLVLRAFA
ncbi:hypothetical protein I5U63_08785 [Stenotrophomonas maltophilia]|nr:hypothetical protein [Stenotrophomonas maltophilia]MBH1669113.1 hypothetical protein [Stenotrophomonas maltophilia]